MQTAKTLESLESDARKILERAGHLVSSVGLRVDGPADFQKRPRWEQFAGIAFALRKFGEQGGDTEAAQNASCAADLYDTVGMYYHLWASPVERSEFPRHIAKLIECAALLGKAEVVSDLLVGTLLTDMQSVRDEAAKTSEQMKKIGAKGGAKSGERRRQKAKEGWVAEARPLIVDVTRKNPTLSLDDISEKVTPRLKNPIKSRRVKALASTMRKGGEIPPRLK